VKLVEYSIYLEIDNLTCLFYQTKSSSGEFAGTRRLKAQKL